MWDPDVYLRFSGHRLRPGLELISRIPGIDPRRIVDLGCGTGELTAVLGRRWPGAEVVGIDSSPEMIERARHQHPDIEWLVADIESWEPADPSDLVYSNAALHWLEDHAGLFPRLISKLAPGGVLAVQMPDNWREPTHRVPAEVLETPSWSDQARAALIRDRVSSVDDYRRWLGDTDLDAWSTTYYQTLTGDDPVWSWVTGSVLAPVLAALSDEDKVRFQSECQKRYTEAYPPQDGLTTLPFSRLFLVAKTH